MHTTSASTIVVPAVVRTFCHSFVVVGAVESAAMNHVDSINERIIVERDEVLTPRRATSSTIQTHIFETRLMRIRRFFLTPNSG